MFKESVSNQCTLFQKIHFIPFADFNPYSYHIGVVLCLKTHSDQLTHGPSLPSSFLGWALEIPHSGTLSVPEKVGQWATLHLHVPFAVGKSAVHTLTAFWQQVGFTTAHFIDSEPKIQQVKHPLRITQPEGSKERSWTKDSRVHFSTPATLGTVTWNPSDWEGEGHVLDTLQHCKHFSSLIIYKYTMWSQAPGEKGPGPYSVAHSL